MLPLPGDSCPAGLMLLHGPHVLWSTLPPYDSLALHRLATAALLPASRGKSVSKRLASAASFRSVLCAGSLLPPRSQLG